MMCDLMKFHVDDAAVTSAFHTASAADWIADQAVPSQSQAIWMGLMIHTLIDSHSA